MDEGRKGDYWAGCGEMFRHAVMRFLSVRREGRTTDRVGFKAKGEPESFPLCMKKTKVRVLYILVEQGSGEELIFCPLRWLPRPGVWTIRVTSMEEEPETRTASYLGCLFHSFLSGDTLFSCALLPNTTITEPESERGSTTSTAYLPGHSNNSFYGGVRKGVLPGEGTSKPDLVHRVNISTVVGIRRDPVMGAAAALVSSLSLCSGPVVEGNQPWMESREKAFLNQGCGGAQAGYHIPFREWGYEGSTFREPLTCWRSVTGSMTAPELTSRIKGGFCGNGIRKNLCCYR